MQAIPDLSGLSEIEFEAERSRIIAEHIKSLPEDRRKKAYALQLELDLKRETMGPEAFMAHCFTEAATNLERIAELFQVAGAMMGLNKPSLPDFTLERSTKH